MQLRTKIDIRPQPGPQTQFLETTADIAIYGGAAGGGKTYGLLIEPLRHFSNPDFGGVIFRRTTKQVRNEGGLWDEAQGLYIPLGYRPKGASLELYAPSGARLQFSHLEYEKNIYDWQGSAIPFLGFDELTHFTEMQFFYMLSRNRSATAGFRPYVRATTNPSSTSWVRKFLDWWIDKETGYAIPSRSGKIRWFVRKDEQLHWASTREELVKRFGKDPNVMPKSVTFIAAKLDDNKILMSKDPSYRANLLALPRVDRMQLLDGNWNVTPSAGLYFKKIWFKTVEAVPVGTKFIRQWDRAATEGGGDYTVGLKLGKCPDGSYIVADLVRDQLSPGGVEEALINTARQDGRPTTVGLFQDPGAAGVSDLNNTVKLLEGFDVKTTRTTVDKITAAKPVSAQVEAGNVRVLRGAWNDKFFQELENFPEDDHDDQVDALSGAFNLHTADNVGDYTASMVAKKGGTVASSSRGKDRKW